MRNPPFKANKKMNPSTNCAKMRESRRGEASSKRAKQVRGEKRGETRLDTGDEINNLSVTAQDAATSIVEVWGEQ
jgi:hypothetical protein